MAEEGTRRRLVRLEGLFWQESQRWRRPARRLRRMLSVLRHRWRAARTPLPPRLLATAPPTGPTPRSLANVRLLTRPTPPATATPLTPLARDGHVVAKAPAVAAEALLMTAAAEDLDLVIAGAGEPESAGEPVRPLDGCDVRLLRAPASGPSPELVGRLVPLLGEKDAPGALTPLPLRVSGRLLLRPDLGDGHLVRRPLYDVEVALGHLEPLEGPPATLFLLPFLAVGGAERLLDALLEDLVRDEGRRSIVVTLDPHRGHLGHTVDRCRKRTPWVLTLGDWMPRECVWSALRHLIRRFRVDRLFSWNGTLDFYDRVHELRRDFPRLRILHQLYHHRGGFTARTSPRVVRAVNVHVAVNRGIVRALEERGVPAERIRLIHHGVEVPAAPPSDAAREERRAERRRQLGLPADAVVIGTFIRLHAQKRPLDLLALANRFQSERFPSERVHFLVVGGGPLEDAIERALEKRPLDNLTRLPMTRDPLPLYDALDLCLMTSSYEGLPVFLLDGLARGLPGVAPAVGDIPLLFAGGGGLTAPRPGDLDGLEAAIRRLLDPAERRRRGELARRTVEEHFSLERYRRDYRRALGDEP